MSYLVFARKWRPQTFEEVVDQKHIARTIQNAIRSNRIAHSFLFTGERGVGKTSVARILAKALNCAEGPTPSPCNTCKSCEEITKGISMDVLEIDGASNNSVDDIRELREKIRYVPVSSRYKVYIIDEVHMLSTSAFNALLKTLEEPPPHAIFILATTEPHKIPDTILSRCQRFDFKRISLPGIMDNLKKIVSDEKIEISEQALFLIARASEGSMRDAQSILERIISYAGEKVEEEQVQEVLGVLDQRLLSEFSSALIERDDKKCLDVIDRIYASGYDLKQAYYSLLEQVRNLLIVKISPDPSRLIMLSDAGFSELREQSGKISAEEIQGLFKLLLQSEEEMQRSPFPKLILEMTILRMVQLRPSLPLDEIITKLRILEGRLLGENVEGTPAPGDSAVSEDIQSISKESPSSPPSSEGKEEIWRRFLEEVQRKKASLASMLEQATLLTLTDEKIEIGINQDSFLWEKVKEKESLAILKDTGRGILKRDVEIKISHYPSGTDGSVSRKPNNHKEQQLKKAQEEAINNPAVKDILDIFGGKIVDVKINP
jgi:DNA polymerase-3 subunit gamma/tau